MVNLSRQIGVTQAQQGGFSSHVLPGPITYNNVLTPQWLFKPAVLDTIDTVTGATLAASTTISTGAISPTLDASAPPQAASGSVLWSGDGIGYIANTDPEPEMGVTWGDESGWTLETWFNWPGGNGSALCRLQNDDGQFVNNRSVIGVGGGNGSTYYLYVEVSGAFVSQLDSNIGDLSGWHHLALVVTAGETAGTARLWLDGADPVASGDFSGTSQGWTVGQAAWQSANIFQPSWTNQVGVSFASHGARYTKEPLYSAPFTPPVF